MVRRGFLIFNNPTRWIEATRSPHPLVRKAKVVIVKPRLVKGTKARRVFDVFFTGRTLSA